MARDTSNLPQGDIPGPDLPSGGLAGGQAKNVDCSPAELRQGYERLTPSWVEPKFRSLSDSVMPGSSDSAQGEQSSADGDDEPDDTGEGRERGSDTGGPGYYPNYERLAWNQDEGRYIDRYCGGFLPRDGYSKER